MYENDHPSITQCLAMHRAKRVLIIIWRCMIILTACLGIWDWSWPPQSNAQTKGNIELREANDLLQAYVARVVTQQPRDIRKAWETKLDQVNLNKHGLYGLTGIHGRIIMEYLPQSKTLHCLAPIHFFRHRPVLAWVIQALKEAVAAGGNTSGAELISDPTSKGIFRNPRALGYQATA